MLKKFEIQPHTLLAQTVNKDKLFISCYFLGYIVYIYISLNLIMTLSLYLYMYTFIYIHISLIIFLLTYLITCLLTYRVIYRAAFSTLNQQDILFSSHLARIQDFRQWRGIFHILSYPVKVKYIFKDIFIAIVFILLTIYLMYDKERSRHLVLKQIY